MATEEHPPKVMIQKAPWPYDLEEAVKELRLSGGLTGWRVWLEEENRGQGCHGLTLNIMPNVPDSYHPEKYANTRFLYPVPAAAFNRDSWEEWIWARIEETQGHERAEGFAFFEKEVTIHDHVVHLVRRPFKPVHADGWDPGFIRKVVSEELADVPNAGRLVYFLCAKCGHKHQGRMGESFTVKQDLGCGEDFCGPGCHIVGSSKG